MKAKLYKAGAFCLLLLGVLHTIYFFMDMIYPTPEIVEALSISRKSLVDPNGAHTLKEFYDGYSLAMGLLLITYGALAMFATPFSRKSLGITIAASAIALVVSIIYFHPLAYGLTGISFALLVASALAKNNK